MHQYNNFISDTHLEVLIDKYHQCDQYESVAFSHCITIDFLIPVHISAGATVIFQTISRSLKKEIKGQLTLQKFSGAAVGGLVTLAEIKNTYCK